MMKEKQYYNERREDKKMETMTDWLKEQISDWKFRVLLAACLLTEIILAAMFGLYSYSVLKSARYLILAGVMFFIAWIDQHERKIPNKILLVLLFIRAVLLVAEAVAFPEIGLSLLITVLFGMLAGGGLFLLAHFITRGGVGMGDVKMFGVIGAYLGGSIMTAVFLTVIVAAVYSIVMLVCRKIKLKEEIPFAPFALAGTILAMAFGM